MLPNNSLSTIPIPAGFLYKVRRWSIPLVDWEQGGTALQDATAGLNVQLWQLQYDDVTGDFNVINADGVSTTVYSRLGAVLVGLAFDQSMTPILCWYNGTDSMVRWLNQSTGQFVVTTVAGATNPCITLDERDPDFLSVSDVIFAYTRADGALCYRQQRDNYGTEYVLSANPGGKLTAIGTNTGLRVQFRLKPNPT